MEFYYSLSELSRDLDMSAGKMPMDPDSLSTHKLKKMVDIIRRGEYITI